MADISSFCKTACISEMITCWLCTMIRYLMPYMSMN